MPTPNRTSYAGEVEPHHPSSEPPADSDAGEVNDQDAELRCDPEREAQALGNVLCNASVFTPGGAEICLRRFVNGEVLRAEVIDCGAGIAAEDLPRVFEPFEQRAVPPGASARRRGIGIDNRQGRFRGARRLYQGSQRRLGARDHRVPCVASRQWRRLSFLGSRSRATHCAAHQCVRCISKEPLNNL
ncbi:sensor histidine kinase [Massilia aurea]|uniref:sensor histidine kinase n=1 Tax=Massilia aurea TaxID=373040 RepID=UPI00351CCFBF